MRAPRNPVLALALTAFSATAAWGQTAPAPAPAATKGIGTVVERKLPAQMKRTGAAAWENVADGEEVRLGDSFRTGENGRLKMIFDDKSILILAEKSRIEITRLIYDPATRRRESLFKLYEGKVRALVGEMFGASSKFEIESPTAVAGAKGTDFEEHWVDPCTTIYSHAGDVYAHNVNPAVTGEVTIGTDMLTRVCEGKGPVEPKQADDAFRKETIPLRSEETNHPPALPEEPSTGGGEEGGPPTDEKKVPDYPTDVIDQPPGAGGLPVQPETPSPPSPSSSEESN